MAGRARRAAGTETGFEVLLRWSGIRRRRPEKDIADFDAGVTLKVIGLTRTLGRPKVRSVGKGRTITVLRSGMLALTAGQEPVWSDRVGKGTATLRGPLALLGDGDRMPVTRKFALFQLTTADGTFDLAVPKKDVALIRHAFASLS
jgi:hypothetical protein